MKTKTAVSVLMILIAASGWGIIGVFSRILSDAGLNALQITSVRCGITAVGMGAFLLVWDRTLLRIRWKDLWMFLGTGLASIVFFNVCYFLTIERATLATASILLYTAPCFVMLISACFFQEKITLQKLTALVLALIGCALASGFAGGNISAWALMTGIGSGLGYALYSIFGKVALRKYQPFTVIFYTFAVATVGLLPFVEVSDVVWTLAGDIYSASAGLALGVVCTLVPFICYTSGLRYVEAGKASVLAFAEPVVATVAGSVLFHERLLWKHVVGILLIFVAIVLLNLPLKTVWKRRRKKAGQKSDPREIGL